MFRTILEKVQIQYWQVVETLIDRASEIGMVTLTY